jgi:preprotein translocase subunit SecB
MTNETDTPDDGADDGSENDQDAPTEQPMVHCHAQFIKDMSFENPNALNAADEDGIAPDVDMNVQVGINNVNDDLYEVTLTVEGKATRNDKHLFMVELHYAGLYAIKNVPKEHIESILYVHCPSLLFPFARQIIAEVTSNGGYPPLLLNAIDFARMYQQQVASKDPAETT